MKWEYQYIAQRDVNSLTLALNEAGEDGWEAFHIESDGEYLMAILKRPKQ